MAREADWLRSELADATGIESRSRKIVERLAIALQAATLFRDGNTMTAELFCASRLGAYRSLCFGGLAQSDVHEKIIYRSGLRAV